MNFLSCKRFDDKIGYAAVRLFLAVLLLGLAGTASANRSEVDVWATFLKDKYFPDIELIESNSVIEFSTPYRAEDASVTPISINAKFPNQTRG